MSTRSCLKLHISIAAMMVVLTVAASAFASGKERVRLASEYPDRHPTIINGIMPWIKDVKDETDGKLNIQFFNPNALCPAKDANAALMSGAADMILTPSQQSARGKFPVSSASLLPFMTTSSVSGSKAVWQLYQNNPSMQKEYEDMKVLWQWVSPPFEIHTSKKHVQTLEDLQGLKLIVWTGDLAKVVSALGANPVETTPHDTYLALQRGMADGVVCPIAPMKAYKITDVTRYHTIVGMLSTHFYAGMNLKKWESLPESMQQTLINTTGEKMVELTGRTLDDGTNEDSEWMKSKGHTITVLPQEERARWQQKTQPIIEEWIAKMEKEGFADARQIVDEAYSLNGN